MGARDKPFRLGDLPPVQRLQTRCGALEYVISGEGEPAIVLFNGAGVALDGWRALYPDIESLGAVLAWNRFGMEGSDDPPGLQSGAVVIASVRELLSYAGLAPPFVLVGHSLGGLYANLFARLHPAEVAGVLLLEATHPGDHDVLQMDEAQLTRALRRVMALPEWVFRDNLHAEVEAVGHVVKEVEGAGPFPPVPLAVITGGAPPPKWIMEGEALQARLAHQRDLARLSPHSEHVVARRSGHFPQLSEPGVVLATLERLVRAAA
ncbi:alpha/beta fold hydrolase [Ramlibacter sp. PS4R-6]|uniref:alpha/beta fold hydrolase n=1 Tax=Ramlibacter sp. PS4R-6 TaxID=3133438 RepID=UPI0030ACD580